MTGSQVGAPADVPLTSSLVDAVETDQLLSALLMSQAEEVFVALGHANSDSTRTTLASPQGLLNQDIDDFTLSGSSQNGAVFQDGRGVLSNVYLAGQSLGEAAIAILSLEYGSINDALLFRLGQSELVDQKASVDTIIRDGNSLFATTSVTNLDGEITQTGLVLIDLD